jgi:hypothetical protein
MVTTMKIKFPSVCLFVMLMLMPLRGLSASLFLTDKQFANRGDGLLIAKITSVQVVSSNQYSESGTVQLNVTSVLLGTLNVSTLTFPYQRSLVYLDDTSNWDLIKPLYVSLQKFGVGRSILIYFETAGDGSIQLAPASNAVQEAADGVLLGTIKAIKWRDRGWDHAGWHVQLSVTETIFGWTSETEIDLPCAGPIDAHLEGQNVVVAFDKSGIRQITRATSAFLTDLQQADMN